MLAKIFFHIVLEKTVNLSNYVFYTHFDVILFSM